ncbi:MAG: helix-turn-helix transcriptional regulator [Oscillospiraceae bacterium]|nr:helix-turn-helix transcriptional regulator [Oscillospiraceae bacterium]
MQVDEKKINVRQSAVDQAIRYVDEHFRDSDLTLELLAKQSYLSKNYFALLFEQQTGYKFKQYVQKKRIALACELLRSTNYTVSAILAQCGYRDSKHFYSIFKKITGMTPSEYRIVVREKTEK